MENFISRHGEESEIANETLMPDEEEDAGHESGSDNSLKRLAEMMQHPAIINSDDPIVQTIVKGWNKGRQHAVNTLYEHLVDLAANTAKQIESTQLPDDPDYPDLQPFRSSHNEHRKAAARFALETLCFRAECVREHDGSLDLYEEYINGTDEQFWKIEERSFRDTHVSAQVMTDKFDAAREEISALADEVAAIRFRENFKRAMRVSASDK